jgi:hypothetical protein
MTPSYSLQQFKCLNHTGYNDAVNEVSERRNHYAIERAYKMLAGNNERYRPSRRPRNRWQKDVTI